MLSARRGIILQTTPGRVSLGKRLETTMLATNHLGYEVQKFVYGEGWLNASPIVGHRGVAELMLEEMSKDTSAEYRVYPALEFPVKKAKP